MKRQLLWLDYSQKDIWRDWLSRLPPDKRDIYFDHEYVALYTEDKTSANCYIYTKDENIYIYPFIIQPVPKITGYFDISTPYGYGGPVFNTDESSFLHEAYQCFRIEALRRHVIAEVIKFHPLLGNHLAITDVFGGEIKRMCSTVYVDIDIDEEYRWKKIYTHMNRKSINKARRNNIVAIFSRDDKSWQYFKSLYEQTMQANKADKYYFFTPGYFKSIQEDLSDNYILVSCAINGRTISVMLVLLSAVYAYCHLIGTDRDFLTTGVNNLLHHELILWCKRNGYRKLFIGGGRTNSDDDSLFLFKKNFSDKTSSMYVGESILNPEIYNELCTEWSLKNPHRQDTVKLLKYRT